MMLYSSVTLSFGLNTVLNPTLVEESATQHTVQADPQDTVAH